MRHLSGRILPGALILALPLGLAPAAGAGNNAQAAIGLHVASPIQKGVCEAVSDLRVATIVVDTPAATCSPGDFYVYSFVCNGSTIMEGLPEGTGVAGMEYGLEYDETLTISSIQLCADLNFPQPGWPASGTGTITTWDAVGNCQSDPSEPFVPDTVIAVAEAFLVTAQAPGQMYVTPRPITGRAKVADCNSAEDDLTDAVPSKLAVAGFCTWGYNACWPGDPVEPVTWGRVKLAYGDR